MDARIKLGVSDECVHFQAGIKKNLADYPEINIVFCSNNGDELLQQAAHNEIDIVLMESKLPIAEGNAINKMQEQFPHVRKIIYTWHTSLRRVETAVAANAFGYLVKSAETTIARVAECINIVYEGGTHFCKLCTPLVQQRLRGEKVQMFNEVELQIIPLMARGKPSREIGELIFKSPLTVESYRKAMLKKTNTRKDTEFISWCYKNEYLDR